jgi:hypothetical protein
MKKLAPVTPKQAAWIILLAAVLWIPMTLFILHAVKVNTPPRTVAVVGIINLFVSVSSLILIYRKWISKLR